jgi:hypothetical protein
VSFAAITLCVTSQRVFIVVTVYFFINSVRKLLDTSPYTFAPDEGEWSHSHFGHFALGFGARWDMEPIRRRWLREEHQITMKRRLFRGPPMVSR